MYVRNLSQICALISRVEDANVIDSTAVIMRCGNANFGDFQCNNSMAISKVLKTVADYQGPIGPKDIADAISKNIPVNHLIESVNTAPNGFINIKIATGPLIQTIASIARDGIQPPSVTKLNVLVDFSSPNIAKEMHVGHLRSTIIGDCICRILEFCGHDVMRVNHVGDWGTQFGMLISYLVEAYPDILTNPPNISDLTAIYKASKIRFDNDEEFKERSRLNVVKLQVCPPHCQCLHRKCSLQSGDEGCRKIWQLLCDISRQEFQKVYDALGVVLHEFGESFYNPMIPDVINELTNVCELSTLRLECLLVMFQLNLIYDENGMLLVKLPSFTIPLILRKSDGGYGYDSTDMAAITYRTRQLKRFVSPYHRFILNILINKQRLDNNYY